MQINRRECPVCGSEKYMVIYEQQFSKLVGTDSSFHQRVGQCNLCGIVYVRDYLTDNDLSKYYSVMSNYEYSSNDNKWPIEDQKKYERQHRFVTYFCEKKPYTNVLDIGCSLGYTLSLFKQDGSSVLGIEPSSKLKEIAKRQYDVDVITDFFNKDLKLPNKYDVVLLSHVAEHLKYPKEIFMSIKEVLESDGLVYVEVPSIELFDERDLFQFSFEHINYFSHGSLSNLMHAAGFEEVDHIVFENSNGVAPFYPTLGTLWRKATRIYPLINRYQHDQAVIERYIKLVKEHAGELNSKIEEVLSRYSMIAIWGAGTLTAQLLAQTPLKNGKVKVIYDSDPKKDGQLMNGIPVKKPKLLVNTLEEDNVDVVIIGSWSSQDDIFLNLLNAGVDEDIIVRLF